MRVKEVKVPLMRDRFVLSLRDFPFPFSLLSALLKISGSSPFFGLRLKLKQLKLIQKKTKQYQFLHLSILLLSQFSFFNVFFFYFYSLFLFPISVSSCKSCSLSADCAAASIPPSFISHGEREKT